MRREWVVGMGWGIAIQYLLLICICGCVVRKQGGRDPERPEEKKHGRRDAGQESRPGDRGDTGAGYGDVVAGRLGINDYGEYK